ncbi:amidohydrolase family protein [Novosphingobium sp. G106]|uniref:amidohydrolase family protein n=1 Tax=Novosphingobium sp. G106 TaxID=2849500 RepID=UPI002810E1DD|nr:amidohydrolase family protein [Novosphingobium sp. G106]
MPRPHDIPVIDTLIGFRDTHQMGVASTKGDWQRHPAEYMFKDIPEEIGEADDRLASIAETLAQMDAHNIRVGVIHMSDDRALEAMRRHPDRFAAIRPVDPNKGMDAVRLIQREYDEGLIKGVSFFPSGQQPPVPINDRRAYPIYAKCIELDLPIFVNVGVPGPRIPMMPQYVGHLDEVCYDLPELKLVMRHGAEPWEDLAVKLLLKWPNLYYSTSAFAPKYWPEAIIRFANSRGSDKVIYGGYFPMGLELTRIFAEMDEVPFKAEVWPKFLYDNAAKVLGLPPRE